MSLPVLGELVATARRQLGRIRRPEYTGENRCYPCTVVNLGITAVMGAVTWSVRPILGVTVVGVGITAIYLRGYLIPRTPTITERYFPEPVLQLFGKADGREVVHRQNAPIAVTAPELSDAAIVTDDGPGSRLSHSFRREWRDRLDTGLPDDDAKVERAVADTLGIAPGAVTAVPGAVAFSTDDRVLQWESSAALAADVAAGTLLADRVTGWTDIEPGRRLELLACLRTLLERCPDCRGTIRRALETPKTCCRDPSPVVLCTCETCDACLVERSTDDLAVVTVTGESDEED